MRRSLALALGLLLVELGTGVVSGAAGTQDPPRIPPGRLRIQIRSTADGTLQDSYLLLPSSRGGATGRRPLVVLLHTWSYDLEQRQPAVEAEVEERDWLLLIPNFRGRNDHPGACGSPLAQQDVLDAVAWVQTHYAVDETRIYLLGMSGGGFMTMLMVARHPQTWAAASAWVGISDLRAWYGEHQDDQYGAMMRACLGGSPSDGAEVAATYRDRSPLTYLRRGLDVPIELAAGRSDPVVSVRHTLQAFRALAPDAVSKVELASLLAPASGLPAPGSADVESDPLIGRRIFLRRTAGLFRVTIFEGGHEWFPRAAIAWLALHRRGASVKIMKKASNAVREVSGDLKPEYAFDLLEGEEEPLTRANWNGRAD
jgi:poly(3-hydroxybutyrate) depolymerase